MAPPYQPPGRCIYCGATSYGPNGGALRSEHIIAAAIDGRWELPGASCRRCEEITGRFEQMAFRGVLRAIRIDMSLGRGKEPVSHLPLIDVDGIPGNKINIDISEYPIIIMLLIFGTPHALAGASHICDRLNEGMFVYVKGGRGSMPFGGREFTSLGLDGLSFSRMLAKSAHAYACAEVGIDNFSPYLIDYILTDEQEKQNFYKKDHIGCAPLVHKRSKNLHRIGIQKIVHDGKTLLIVDLRLFCLFRTPCYRIVVGELADSAFGKVRLAEDGLYAYFEEALPAGR